jgi:hypothetical protein
VFCIYDFFEIGFFCLAWMVILLLFMPPT